MVEDSPNLSLLDKSACPLEGSPRKASRWASLIDLSPRAILCLLAYKAMVLGLAFFYACVSPASFSQDGFKSNFHRNERPGRTERFTTWDGEHYLFLSERGFSAGSSSAAFYPLWPELIRIGSRLMNGHSALIALGLSNLLSLAAWVLFHRLVASTSGTQTANYALALLLAYPGSLFFQFPYSESLFLFLIVLFFIGLFRDKVWLVILTGFLLPLTRATGIFCVFPLLWHVWEQVKTKSGPVKQMTVLDLWRTIVKERSWFCLAPIVGYASYFVIMKALTGNAFEGFAAQKNYVNAPSIANILNIPGFFAAFLRLGLTHGMTESPLDRAFFVLFCLSLPPLWRINKYYFFYALATGLIPAMSNYFFSYTRFLVLCFPVFIVLAEQLKNSRRDLYAWSVFVAFLGIQISLIIRHVNFRWAG